MYEVYVYLFAVFACSYVTGLLRLCSNLGLHCKCMLDGDGPRCAFGRL